MSIPITSGVPGDLILRLYRLLGHVTRCSNAAGVSDVPTSLPFGGPRVVSLKKGQDEIRAHNYFGQLNSQVCRAVLYVVDEAEPLPDGNTRATQNSTTSRKDRRLIVVEYMRLPC